MPCLLVSSMLLKKEELAFRFQSTVASSPCTARRTTCAPMFICPSGCLQSLPDDIHMVSFLLMTFRVEF